MRRKGHGNADVSALPLNERLHGTIARVARGRRHRRTSASGAARTSTRRTARRGHAELALSDVNLSVVHVGNRYIPRAVRVFKEFAVQMAPTLFQRFRLNRRTLLASGSRSTVQSQSSSSCQFGSISSAGAYRFADLHFSETPGRNWRNRQSQSKIRRHFGKYRTAIATVLPWLPGISMT